MCNVLKRLNTMIGYVNDLKRLEISEEELVWGAAEIGKVINRSPRQTFHLLESGLIPGARKLGGQWVASKRVLLRPFLEVSSDGN
jgi:hypothetical protein